MYVQFLFAKEEQYGSNFVALYSYEFKIICIIKILLLILSLSYRNFLSLLSFITFLNSVLYSRLFVSFCCYTAFLLALAFESSLSTPYPILLSLSYIGVILLFLRLVTYQCDVMYTCSCCAADYKYDDDMMLGNVSPIVGSVKLLYTPGAPSGESHLDISAAPVIVTELYNYTFCLLITLDTRILLRLTG
jgi:hypothetical protein